MKENTIDARGLSCPQPVVLTAQAIKKGIKNFDILVNSDVSRENVIRCINKNNYKYKITSDGDSYVITVYR